MTDTDDLRDTLIRRLDLRDRVEIVDALMPVVCKALADGWNDGHEWGAHNEHEFRPGRKITNPWREDDDQ